ncbi:MAG: NAD-dependent DNA ligase LigA, partial [Clostridiales bacterium]|nr:NAD-dependent DNA ligase LigA [Clostridiales bacterium]
INGVGVATANIIGRACNNSWARIESMDEESLLAINGVGEVLAQDYLKFFHNERNKALITALLDRVELDENFDEQGSGLSGMIFVITGSLNHYENRKDLKADIEKEGGKVAGSVSSKTTYLITNDKSSGSSKNEKARELGVSIIDEDEVIQMLRDAN